MTATTRARIAVVEDSRDNRLLVRAIVDGRYDLDEYVSGIEALDGIRRAPPDLVLLDVSLPAMDGTEVLRHLRADPALAAIPVVAITAHAMRRDRERFTAAGFDECVIKPIVNEQRFLATVAHWLEVSAHRAPANPTELHNAR